MSETGTLLIEWALTLDGPATLVVRIDGRHAAASLVTLAGTRLLGTGSTMSVVDADLEHIDAPGIVSLTVRNSDPVELLFARTALLETLGALGGRIERPRLTKG